MTGGSFVQQLLALGDGIVSPEKLHFRSEWEKPELGKFAKGREEEPGWVGMDPYKRSDLEISSQRGSSGVLK